MAHEQHHPQHPRLLRSVLLGVALLGLAIWFSAGREFWFRAAGLLLLLLVLYTFVALLLPVHKHRPPRAVIHASSGLTVFALLLFLACALFRVSFPVSQSQDLAIGGGALTYVVHSPPGTSRPALAPTARYTRNAWETLLGITFIASRSGPSGTSSQHGGVCPTWPLLVATAIPTSVLWRLRRDRVPPGHCPTCGYDLTGNVTGRCPECGNVIQTAADTN